MSKKIVIALGGNALGKTATEQKEAVKITARTIVDLYEAGNKVIVCHGNGPQVGLIESSLTAAAKANIIGEVMPFAECGAMSQGYIGFHIQNAVKNELTKRNLKNTTVSLITQTIVDANDHAFKNPTKPIGTFMNEAEAKNMAETNGWVVKEDAGRGWRRVVPSPKPIEIVERDAITALADKGFIVIAGGGGGIPVIKKGDVLVGVDSVIDKDYTSAKMAELVDADMLMILTAVDKVMINYGKSEQASIDEINVKDLQNLVDADTFAAGSMKPKVEAALSFVRATKKPAFIADLKLADKVLKGDAGTKIIA